MKNITCFLLKGESNVYQNEIDFKPFHSETIIKDIENAISKYILFIKDIDSITDQYFQKVISLATKKFDVSFINYTIEIEGKTLATEKLATPEIQKKPHVGDYIWSYLWKKEKLLELFYSEDKSDEKVDEIFRYVNYIEEPVYHHVLSKKQISNFIYTDEKDIVKRKNVFYLGTYCNGKFNGYITWLKNIGRCFSKEYQITILYDKIYEPTKKVLEEYFEVIQRKEDTNYLCERLFVTYSTYYYPKNILVTGENYLFIHGNMSDFEKSRSYQYDNYTKYIAVSEIAAKKAVGYFPTKQIDYILNPIKLDLSKIKTPLKLVSAQRNDPIKKPTRIHSISKILDEEEIPYTWNIFTDSPPFSERVYGGVIYRHSISDTLPYIKDADYYVQLSDSEACSYSVLEALYLNTKVILTPLECYQEMNVDETQGFIIPFDYFEEENKEKLREIVLQIVKEKNRKMNNKLSPEMYEKYKELLLK